MSNNDDKDQSWGDYLNNLSSNDKVDLSNNLNMSGPQFGSNIEKKGNPIFHSKPINEDTKPSTKYFSKDNDDKNNK